MLIYCKIIAVKKLSIILFILLIPAIAGVRSSAAEKYVLFILDTSSSMYGIKIRMAKGVILTALKNRPSGTEIALRVFNQEAEDFDESCLDSDLILDFNDYDIEVFKETLDKIRISGQSPLAQTLREGT